MTAAFRDRRLWAIIALALILRVAVACLPVIHHPDEIWQYLEPTHHLVVGPWVQTWEARAGIRSWLLPMLFAGPMAVGHFIAPLSMLDIVLPRLVCVAISLGVVLGAAGLGFRLSRLHGLVAAFVAAIWYELVYFGPRTMSEPIATAFFLAAAWLLLGDRSVRRTVIGGLLLGLCVVVRFQYAPPVLVLAIATAGLRRRDWINLAAGGAVALALSAAADGAMGMTPFAWIIGNITLNLVANRSADFGVTPAWGYLSVIAGLWGWATVPILGSAILGTRRYPALMIAALVNLAVHSAIPHKEYRFILLTTTILVVLAALGSVDAFHRYRNARMPLLLTTGWLLLSVASGALGSSTREWAQNAKLFTAWRIAGAAPNVCGVGIYQIRESAVASYTLYRRETPIYRYGAGETAIALSSRAFNVVIAPGDRGGELAGYRLVGCGDTRRRNYCVYTRPGACILKADDSAYEVNRALQRTGS
ncbi:MAG: mannosyltransferase [Sphingomonas sp.]